MDTDWFSGLISIIYSLSELAPEDIKNRLFSKKTTPYYN